jgi:hypothetical protein
VVVTDVDEPKTKTKTKTTTKKAGEDLEQGNPGIIEAVFVHDGHQIERGAIDHSCTVTHQKHIATRQSRRACASNAALP